MILSKTAEIAAELVDDTLELVRSDRGDAMSAGFKPEEYKSVVNGMEEKNLQHLQRLIKVIQEDAQTLERRMMDAKAPDEYGRDEETGKKIGKLYLAE